MEELKAALRTDALLRRSGLPSGQNAASGAALATALLPWSSSAGGTVAAYAAQGSEPGTAALLAGLAASGVDVLLPVLRPDLDLDWARWSGELVPGPRGTVEPLGPRLGCDAVAACGLVVVPALAVDWTGTRLGRGGGSYDRALARSTGWLVAALHPGEVVDRLPSQAHDVPVHAAVLPGRGVVRMRPHPLDGGSPAPDCMKR